LKQIVLNKLDLGFKAEIAIQSGEILTRCVQCGTCTGNCVLANVDDSFNPRSVVRIVLLGGRDYFREHPEVPYACNICELCKGLCPRGLNISNLCLALREQLVEEGIGPLPGHKVVQDTKQFVQSPSFTLTKVANGTDKKPSQGFLHGALPQMLLPLSYHIASSVVLRRDFGSASGRLRWFFGLDHSPPARRRTVPFE